MAQARRVGPEAANRLLTKRAPVIGPGRFLLYIAAAAVLLVGLAGLGIFVPSASVTLVAQAQPFAQRDVEIQAQPGKAPIRVRVTTISRSDSQGFKTTGVKQVLLAPATGQVTYTNNCSGGGHTSPGILLYRGQRLTNSNKIEFAQTTGDTVVKWGSSVTGVNIVAVVAGSAGDVASGPICGANPIEGT